MPETTDNYQRIPVADRLPTDKIRTITVDASRGILALYSTNRKRILTYLLPRDKFSMAEARQWVRDHAKGLSNMTETKAPPEAVLEFKTLSPTEVKVVDADERIVEGWISTVDVDYAGDIMDPEGCDTSAYKGVVLYNHNPNLPPVGKCIDLQKVPGKGIRAKWQIARNVTLAEDVWSLLKQKMLPDLSIGFRTVKHAYEKAKDKTVRRVSQWSLHEFSHVPMGMNASAEVLAAKGLLEAEAARPLIEDMVRKALAEAKASDAPVEDPPKREETDEPEAPVPDKPPEADPHKKSHPFDTEQETVSLLNTANLLKSFLADEVKVGRKIAGARLARLQDAVRVLSEIILEAQPASAEEEGPEEAAPEKAAAPGRQVYDQLVELALTHLRAAE